jgi:polysaccharide biosynthesis/export protein
MLLKILLFVSASALCCAQANSTTGTTPATAAPTKKPYVIGPLDVLIIKVWNNPNLSGPANVGSDGMLSIPLIGEVKADGLTQKQLKESLTERLKEFLNNPEVDVQIGKVNSKRYFVYGGVQRAGEFPLIQDTTVMDAMSLVGGFKDFANPKKIRIQRGTQEFIFNYKDVSRGKKMEQNILLENGDRIFVPE